MNESAVTVDTVRTTQQDEFSRLTLEALEAAMDVLEIGGRGSFLTEKCPAEIIDNVHGILDGASTLLALDRNAFKVLSAPAGQKLVLIMLEALTHALGVARESILLTDKERAGDHDQDLENGGPG